jgi:hypothetical protein
MTIKTPNGARQLVNARLQSYVAAVKEQLPTSSMQFWDRIEPPSSGTEER